ncbi:MAG: DUF1269 domain-containing protein [Bacteroidota bacterium]
MNRIIVSIFDSEENAFKGQSALKELHQNGDISLYASAVLSKNDHGKVEMKTISEKGPLGTRVGLVAGAFIGLMGGPIGIAVGASVGALGGMIYDTNNASLDAGFIDEVAAELEHGKTAVIAEVEEVWTTPIDTKLESLNAIVFRRNQSEVVDEQLSREAEATQTEILELKEELADAKAEHKAKIEAQLTTAKEKMKTLKEIAERKLSELVDETKAKTTELEKQIASASERKKKKLEKRKEELQATFNARKEKFDYAINKFKDNFA